MNQTKRSKYMAVNSKIYLKILSISFLFSTPLITLYVHLNDRTDTLNSFNANKELICKVASVKININPDDNWKYEDYYFIKDDSKIITSKCRLKD